MGNRGPTDIKYPGVHIVPYPPPPPAVHQLVLCILLFVLYVMLHKSKRFIKQNSKKILNQLVLCLLHFVYISMYMLHRGIRQREQIRSNFDLE